MNNCIKLILISFSFFLFTQLKAQDDCSVAGFSVVSKKTLPAGQYAAYPTRTVCQLPGFYENMPVIATNIYGSRTDKRTTATGYYYVKMIDGRWWVVDPYGYLNLCKGVNAIAKGDGAASNSAFVSKYGNSSTTWMNQTMQYLNELGFNCAGSWSSTSTITTNPRQTSNPLAYTIILNWMSGYAGNRIDPNGAYGGYPDNVIFTFEKAFVTYCDTKAQTLAINKNDKNLFGYFSDNELPFFLNSLNKYIRRGKTMPADESYLTTTKWLSDNGYTQADTTKADVQEKFLGYLAETYFSIVNNAIKKYDPNHMYIGARNNRIEAMNSASFMQASGRNVDIMSFNYYGSWTPNSSMMLDWGKNLNKPFMVTEFYTKGEDSGLANTTGGGWILRTQLDRGYAYQHFTLALLESKNCVGWHWFKYMDNDPTTGTGSNIDSNKGIVKINYEPYTPLADKMKDINLKVYNLIDYFDSRPVLVSRNIYPEADAYYKGAENHGVEDRLGIKNSTDNNVRESFLRFDLTGQNKNASNVNLYLSVLRSGDAGISYKADFVSDDTWTESSISLANHPTGIYEIGRWSNGLDVILDVKKPFVETIDSDNKLSIKLSALNTCVSQWECGSRENVAEVLRPRIQITENAPDGATDAAYLTDLIIQDKLFPEFQHEILSYNITLASHTTSNPKIQYNLPNSLMKVEVTNPVNVLSVSASDRVATIKTTSADGTKTLIYTLRFLIGTASSLKELKTDLSQNDFSFYPNPVAMNGTVFIQKTNNDRVDYILTISNLSGEVLFHNTTKVSGLTLPVNISPGMYFISISNNNGKCTRKLIVK